MSDAAQRMTTTALNRALLARQGLLERLDLPLVDAVEAVGALQAQYWPAPPAALWSRVEGFEPEALYAALDDGELVAGTLLRATLHLVSAREHPAYAAVAAEAAGHHWRRTDDEPGAEVGQLLTKLRTYARRTPRSAEEIGAFVEEWVAEHPKALSTARARAPARAQVAPVPALVGLRARAGRRRLGHEGAERPARGPAPARRAQGRQGARRGRAPPPAGVRAGGRPTTSRAGSDGARRRCATAFERLGARARALRGRGRPRALRPARRAAARPRDAGPAAPAGGLRQRPARLRRQAPRRASCPTAHRDAVYERRNLQIRPSYLVDGLVAGTWSIEVKRREATLTLRPLERLARATRGALVDEAERLVRALQPQAKGHAVVVAR